MPTDYLRLYVRNATVLLMERLSNEVPQLRGLNIIDPDSFDYTESYGYSQHPNDIAVQLRTRVQCALLDTHVILEHRQPSTIPESQLWRSPGSTVISDVLTLCSIALSEYFPSVFVEQCNEGSIGFNSTSSPSWPPKGTPIIPISELSNFIREGLSQISDTAFVETKGLLNVIPWYVHGQRHLGAAPSAIPCTLYWLALDNLASYNVSRRRLRDAGLVKQYLRERGFMNWQWEFLEPLVDDWWAMRCYSVHPHVRRPHSGLEMMVRLRQLADSAGLLIVDALQPASHRTDVASQIQEYHVQQPAT